MAKEILLLSDSHGYAGESLILKGKEVDEVWHAGDWGDLELSDALSESVTLRGVYGNIDNHIIRKVYPKELIFEVEGLKVYMIHIGGYPGKYAPGVKQRLETIKPGLFISGHSHICKVMRDNNLNLIHINPGAIGNKGFHKKRTMVRFCIDNGKIQELRVLEYDKDFQTQD